MSADVRVDVVLSTYNGGRYLQDQLDSIAAQRDVDWHLLVRDDGSDDETVDILRRFRDAYPQCVTLVDDGRQRLGVVRSFETLMQLTEAEYIAFCDQDDVWLQDKLSILLAEMRRVESHQEAPRPVLVHSDLRVVDERMTLLSDSFWRYQKLAPERMQQRHKLLVQNCVTGCAMLINRILLESALPISERAIMHDWWLALVASCCGEIVACHQPTIYYRQHGRNDTGAKHWGVKYIIATLLSDSAGLRSRLMLTREQAAGLLESGLPSGCDLDVVREYVELFDRNWLQRRLSLLRGGYLKHGFLRNLGMMLSV